MKKLSKSVAVMFVMFNILVFAVIWFARQTPVPPIAAMLHLEQCQIPCWIGISPGANTLYEAKEKIQQFYSNFPNYQVSFLTNSEVMVIDKDKGLSLDVGLSSYNSLQDYSIVSSILIVPYLSDSPDTTNIGVPLADLITVLGTPAYTFPLSGGIDPYVQLWYPLYGVITIDCLNDDIFQSEVPNITFQVHSPDQDINPSNPIPWRGWWATCQFWRTHR